MIGWFYYLCMFLSITIAAGSQILLKKTAQRKYKAWYQQFLDPMSILAYGCMVLSTLFSVIAHREIPLSIAPVWNSSSFMMVALFSFLFLGEKPSKQKWKGMILMVIGIIVFSLKV